MKRTALALLLLFPLAGVCRGAVVLYEDFEDAVVGYTTARSEFIQGGAGSNSNAYVGRYVGADIDIDDGPGGDYAFAGDHVGFRVYAAEDINFDAGPDTQTLTWSLAITGLTALEFEGYFAAGNNNNPHTGIDAVSRYDNVGFSAYDYIQVTARIDGGPIQNLLWFTAWDGGVGDSDNRQISRDADFDGVGDHLELLTSTLTPFSAPIAGTGTTLELVVSLRSTSSNESLAFDNVRVQTVPEPSTIALLALVAGGALVQRRRRTS